MPFFKKIKIKCFLLFLIFCLFNCKGTQQQSTTIVNMNDYYVLVKDFGAKGDGKTNDTKAIQDAINTACKSGGKLLFGKGDFIISKTLTIPSSGLTIEGTSYEFSIIKYIGGKTSAIIESKDDSGFLTIRNLGLYGNNENDYGFLGRKITYTNLERIRIFNCAKAGIGIGYGWCNAIRDCLIQKCHHGLELVVGQCNALTLDHNVFLDLTGVGVMFSATDNLAVKISNCVFEKINQAGVYINSSENIDIDNCYFEEIATGGFQFSNISEKIKANIIINGAGTPAIAAHATPTKGARISNCFVAPYNSDYLVYTNGVHGLNIENNSIRPKKDFKLLGVNEALAIAGNKNILVRGNIGAVEDRQLKMRIQNDKLHFSETYKIEN